jgi:putative transposase
MKRVCVMELIVDEGAEKRLRQLCDLSSKLWNEVNYVRLRMWLERKHIDFKGTYKEFYEKYRPLIGSATAQQILNKNNDAWKTFFRLLELRREGRLPPFMTKVNPPGFGKRNGSRTLWTAIRKDKYEIDGDRIIIKCLGAVGWIEVKYRGIIYLRGERGELKIRYDADRKRWYAHIAFSKIFEKMVRGEWRRVPQQPKGNLTAGIDIGINNLMAIYLENSLMKLVNGRPLKSISYYWRERIAEYLGPDMGVVEVAVPPCNAFWISDFNREDADVIEPLHGPPHPGINIMSYLPPPLCVHPPKLPRRPQAILIQRWYGYLLRRIREVAEEYGISVIYVDESYTSSRCPLHGDGCGVRIHRGLFKCTQLNEIYNADIAAAYNILKTQITEDTNNPRAPKRGGGNGRRPGQGLNLLKEEGCSPNLPTQAGEEVSSSKASFLEALNPADERGRKKQKRRAFILPLLPSFYSRISSIL